MDRRDYDLSILAHAKVNLSLEVLGRRHDGYREIRSVMHTISLADRLEFSWGKNGQITLTCSRPDLANEDNLAYRAAMIQRATWPSSIGAKMHLEKNIPVAAGLGGGSSDAIAAFIGTMHLWGLERTPEDLLPMAQQLGADVPFFIVGGCAVAWGRGDDLAILSPVEGLWLVLLTPPNEIPDKTARLYEAITAEHYSNGDATADLVDVLRTGGRPDPKLFVNVFEQVADSFFPDLPRYRRALLDAGAASVHLSGAGPTLFTLVDSEAEGRALVGRLGEAGFSGTLVHTVPSGWEYGPPGE